MSDRDTPVLAGYYRPLHTVRILRPTGTVMDGGQETVAGGGAGAGQHHPVVVAHGTQLLVENSFQSEQCNDVYVVCAGVHASGAVPAAAAGHQHRAGLVRAGEGGGGGGAGRARHPDCGGRAGAEQQAGQQSQQEDGQIKGDKVFGNRTFQSALTPGDPRAADRARARADG